MVFLLSLLVEKSELDGELVATRWPSECCFNIGVNASFTVTFYMNKSEERESTNMVNYDIFAKFYDSVMGSREKTAAKVSGLIKKHNPSAETVLELAAGTGQNLANLYKDYEVSGLDLSEGMLQVAKTKLPGAKFYHQSMVDFRIDQKYDVIISLFDSVNHLLDFDDWKRMFQSVKSHLAHDGIFIFDVNTPEKLQRVAQEKPFTQEFEGNKMEMSVQDEGGGVVNWRIKFFEGDSPVALEENIKEIAFPTSEVKKALERVFSVVEVSEELNPETGVIERVYFCCKNISNYH